MHQKSVFFGIFPKMAPSKKSRKFSFKTLTNKDPFFTSSHYPTMTPSEVQFYANRKCLFWYITQNDTFHTLKKLIFTSFTNKNPFDASSCLYQSLPYDNTLKTHIYAIGLQGCAWKIVSFLAYYPKLHFLYIKKVPFYVIYQLGAMTKVHFYATGL